MDPEKFRLHSFVKKLDNKRARHTELISVYIPSGFDLNIMISMLQQERGTAENIKSATVRKNVTIALEKIVQKLRASYKQTPPKGIAIFCGNISEDLGREDFVVEMIEPPEPLKVKIYRCEQEFILDPLKEQLVSRNVYGLLTMDKSEAAMGFLDGNIIKVIKVFDPYIMGKSRAGGQSAERFQRIRDGQLLQYYKEVAEACRVFIDPQVKGVFIGGPVPTKDNFVARHLMPLEVEKKIIKVVDMSIATETSLKDLVELSKDALRDNELVKESQIVNEFFKRISTGDSKILFGKDQIIEALNSKIVERLLLSENIDNKLMDELLDLALKTGVEFDIISRNHSEGEQFYQIGGVGAILRY
ncbi:MAG: peptide chain release factor 1 [Euryarchaeota archaeon HGW-Euryarchaeota-1]|nr:MAG: peptide chain release factor 1 [Euryarchaeota archaeon HGW-Euryarchaeota-1]